MAHVFRGSVRYPTVFGSGWADNERSNIATHMIGIPIIAVSIAILLSRPGIDVAGLQVTPALALTAATVLQ